MPDITVLVDKTVKLPDESPRITLKQPLAYDNAKAHTVMIRAVNRDGTDADLTGVGVNASMLRADGQTVFPINGSTDGNVAFVILPASCYLVPGRFKLTLNLTLLTDPEGVDDFSTETSYTKGALVVHEGVVYRFTTDHAAGAWTGNDAVLDSATRTALWVEGNVERNISTDIIDPGTPVTNIEGIIETAQTAAQAAASAAAEAIEAAQEAEGYTDAIAPDYADVVFPVASGAQLCWHEGTLYVSSQTITTAEAWDADHWTETDVSSELARCIRISGPDIATVAEAKTYLDID